MPPSFRSGGVFFWSSRGSQRTEPNRSKGFNGCKFVLNSVFLRSHMGMTHIQTPPKWRTLLILGRASNVPTVWSNCLAGWLIGGMAEYVVLLWLCLGGTLLHIGGMYLNDAFDVGFDRRFRQERPIPAGHIEEKTVWVLGGRGNQWRVFMPRLGRKRIVGDCASSGCFHSALRRTAQAFAPALQSSWRHAGFFSSWPLSTHQEIHGKVLLSGLPSRWLPTLWGLPM